MAPTSTHVLFDDTYPQLVVGTPDLDIVKYTTATPQHPQWHHLYHQCGGLACSHVELLAAPLPMTPAATQLAAELHERYDETNQSDRPAALPVINTYAATIGKYGLACDHTYPLFAEALYPFDHNQDVWELLTVAPWANQQQLRTPNRPGSITSAIQWRFGLYLLHENSD